MAKENRKTPLEREAEEFANRLRSDFDEKRLSEIILEGLSSSEQTRRRGFNTAEKITGYVLAGGRCQLCNAVLDENWELDHVHPFSKGGETTISNAQALCRACNRKKGDR